MKTNRWIEFSRRVYARLLSLYPRQHRADYGAAMQQLFHDQCRAAYDRRGPGAPLGLWMRTLLDLGSSAVSEHLSAPGARWGLLDAVPDQPLPWKGVALVLVPGLIFFVSQLGQLGGEMWFFLVLKWAPYLLMVPVLLAWLTTRRYPIWGLIPLGLLCSSLVTKGSDLMGRFFRELAFTGPIQKLIFPPLRSIYNQVVYKGGFIWMVTGLLIVLALLVWAVQRHRPLSRASWVWLGTFILLGAMQVLLNPHNYMGLGSSVSSGNMIVHWDMFENVSSVFTINIVQQNVQFWTLVGSSLFLVLVFAGTLLARRYGDLAILFPLGYVLGDVVYGFYVRDFGEMTLYLVVGVVLLYRTLVALVIPIWLSRASGPGRNWALGISLVLAFGAKIVLNLVMMQYFYTTPTGDQALIPLALIVDPLVVVAGLAFAITLYRGAMPTAEQNVLPVPVPATGTVQE